MPNRRVFVAAFAFFVAITGSWAGAHFARPLPAPHWTDADLPPLPPESENVYSLLAPSSIRVPDLDALIAEEGSDLSGLMQEARARDNELRRALAPTEELRAAIRRRPRYVESAGMLGRPHVLEGMGAWKTRSLGVVLALVDGDHHLAAEEVASMWTQAVDYSSHCQSMVSCMAGQRLMQLSLGSAELLISQSPESSRWLARIFASSVLDRSAIASGIIAEYVYARVALETYEAPLLDRAHTDTLLSRHFDAALAFANDPSKPRPVADFRSHPLWWLYNPAGKRLASGSTVEHIDRLIERYGREADTIERRRDDLVRRAADGAATELAGEDARTVGTLDTTETRGGRERE